MPPERVSSTVLIASIRVVVVGIENPGKNDANGPRHARVTLIRIYITDPYRTQSRNGKCVSRGRSSANTAHTMQILI
jgi:hypothetical protein